AFLVVFVRLFHVDVQRPGTQLLYFGVRETSGLPIWITLPIIFLAVALVMAMLAQGVGRSFVLFEPLEAYRLDILGSIAGIVTFSLLSLLQAPPLAWGLVVSAIFLLLYLPAIRLLQVAAALGIVVILGQETFAAGETWSPYYRVSLIRKPPVIYIAVNGVPHQQIEPTAFR